MAVVSALRATRRGGVALHLDGEFACTISQATVARWRLFKGRQLDDETVAQIRHDASAQRVMADAYRLLGHRARSRGELERRLFEKEHEEAFVREALDKLAGDGHLDDAAFAHSYVADKRRLSGWGAERIRRGLAALEVAPEVIEHELAIEAEASPQAEFERALEVLRRRGAPQPPLEMARRRAYQVLLRRGFPAPTAYAAVRRWTEVSPPDAELTR